MVLADWVAVTGACNTLGACWQGVPMLYILKNAAVQHPTPPLSFTLANSNHVYTRVHDEQDMLEAQGTVLPCWVETPLNRLSNLENVYYLRAVIQKPPDLCFSNFLVLWEAHHSLED